MNQKRITGGFSLNISLIHLSYERQEEDPTRNFKETVCFNYNHQKSNIKGREINVNAINGLQLPSSYPPWKPSQLPKRMHFIHEADNITSKEIIWHGDCGLGPKCGLLLLHYSHRTAHKQTQKSLPNWKIIREKLLSHNFMMRNMEITFMHGARIDGNLLLPCHKHLC